MCMDCNLSDFARSHGMSLAEFKRKYERVPTVTDLDEMPDTKPGDLFSKAYAHQLFARDYLEMESYSIFND